MNNRVTLPWQDSKTLYQAAEFCAGLEREGIRFEASVDGDTFVIRLLGY